MPLCAATLNSTGLLSEGGHHDDDAVGYVGGDDDGDDDGDEDGNDDDADGDDGGDDDDDHCNTIRSGHACGLPTLPSPGLLLNVMQKLQVRSIHSI